MSPETIVVRWTAAGGRPSSVTEGVDRGVTSILRRYRGSSLTLYSILIRDGDKVTL